MKQHTVLVVDDEPFICRSLSFVLRKGNYIVVEARNGEEALAAIRLHKPDLVFMDVMMPKKNGYEVCQELKSDSGLSDIHIVMLSAKGQESDKEKALTLGADEFMTKPFSPAGVVERVTALLG